MRLVGWLVGDVLLAGVLITYAAGVGALVLFHRWCSATLGRPVARLAAALVVGYPFSYYLFGVVYSDALFLLAALAAFILLEDDHPILAGLAGALATAARPVGIAVVAGLLLRTLELRGVFGWTRPSLFRGGVQSRALRPRRLSRGTLRLADAGVLISVVGLAAYCLLLWQRFGDPIAFERVSSAAGWSRHIDLQTAFKVTYVKLFFTYPLNTVHFGLTVQAVATVISLGLLPAVARRFGWGYTAYVAIAVGLAGASSAQFIGMGRYVLVAFPCFGAAADLLVGWARRRPRLPALVLVTNALLLVYMTSLFVRWVYLS